MAKAKDFLVRNMFGYRTQDPLVMIRLGEEFVQVPPEEAEAFAYWLLEAAAASRSDAAIIRTINALMPEDDQIAGLILNELRQARENQNKPTGRRADILRRLRDAERVAAEHGLAAAARAWLANSEAAGVAGRFAAELVARFRAEYDRN